MKQLFNFALIGAIALTSATMFVGCNSSEDAVETNNPNYNEKTDEVNVQFVLNVAANTGDNTTRQGAATVQKANNFRGLKDAKLIALKTDNPTWLAPFDGSASTSMGVKTFELGTLYTSSQIPTPDTQNPGSRSNRILQLSLPTGMDAMLVYARAIQSGDTEEDGKVEMNVTAAPENTTFTLQSRLGENGTKYQHVLDLSVTIFNFIMDAQISDVAAGAGEVIHDYTNTAAITGFTWRSLGDTKAIVDGLTGLPEILGKDYYAITTLTELPSGEPGDPDYNAHPNEYRAGSSEAVRHLIYHIYTDCIGILGATATTDKEYAAQLLAKEIKGRIDNYFTSPDNETSIAFKSVTATGTGSLQNNLNTDLSIADFNTRFSGVTDIYMAGFPSSFGLPDGVALMTIDENKDFTYDITSTTTLLDGMTNVSQYMYPAELLYFDNSALRCNTTSVPAGNYPDGYNTWDVDAWAGWTVGNPGGIVSSSTRSVAVKNNINYGVAMLKTAVQLDGSTFNDNRNAFTGEADQALTTTNVSGFKLTGVLVGGQNYQMGWNYLAKDPNTATKWNYVVYDNKIENSGAIPTTVGDENYTLLFDNYNFTGTQSDVLVALEFENNGVAFYGEHNLIPVGGKFYLVGKLELGNNTIATNQWDQYYPVPPYFASGENAGKSQKITRIFIQDFMTSATFKIGANSLQKAFNTIPDLRSTQTSLGLSVNLEWKQGLVFDNVPLGH